MDYIIPKQTSELSFDEAVKSLMELYCPKTSLFHKRWKCINLISKEGQDYTTFASDVNRHCDDFGLSSLSVDNFKVLIFIQGLVSIKDAEPRRRALNRLEKEPNITLQQLAEECQRIISEKQDSKNIGEAGVAHIRKVRSNKILLSQQSTFRKNLKRSRICPVTHAKDVENFTGRTIVHIGPGYVFCADTTDTKPHIADQKDPAGAT